MFDLKLGEGVRSDQAVNRLRQREDDIPLRALLDDSAEWIFGTRAASLPDLQRFFLPVNFKKPHAQGATILFDSRQGLGVLSVWHSFQGNEDPLQIKRHFWDDADEILSDFEGLGFDLVKTERLYPFLSIKLAESDVPEATRQHAIEIGRLFTGDFESEEDTYLSSYITTNLSHRTFERLFVRWTDALAIYGQDGDERDCMILPMLRAAQVYERCVLLEQILKRVGIRTNMVYRRLSPFRPWTMLEVGRIHKTLSELEDHYLLAPSVVSVEAQRLMSAAFERFGIVELASSTKQRYELLDQRFQWTRMQLLVAVGVLTWCIDTVAKLLKR